MFIYFFEKSGGNNIYTAGDMPRDGELDDIGYLLDKGVRVALIYGKSLDLVPYVPELTTDKVTATISVIIWVEKQCLSQ